MSNVESSADRSASVASSLNKGDLDLAGFLFSVFF